MKQFELINPNDNVLIALTDLTEGSTITDDRLSCPIILKNNIPQGHKFALKNISKNTDIIKYGFPIGHATKDILVGEHVHTHNITTNLGEILDYTYNPTENNLKNSTEGTFNGYVRKDGKVGIRNEIWIIPTVGCVNNVATEIAKRCNKNLPQNVQEVIAFNHPHGCSQMAEDQENTRNILSDLVKHPNAGGVLVLGLGCEYTNVEVLKKYIGEYDENRVKFLVSQDYDDEIEESCIIVDQLIKYASTFNRQEVSTKHLIVGLKCGGSDGMSGITANPTVGGFSDILVSKGGSTILTEVPEMFGAETILMNRCKTKNVFDKTVSMINGFKQYFINHNLVIYENPSPGNKEGGISTLEDKSLGCTQKSGTAPVADVLKYGELISQKGLNLLDCPSNDLVASSGVAASGAQIVLFTTGRGTPFACPVPTVKIATNNKLATKKSNWIDFNCGVLVENSNIQKLSNDLYDFVISVANGEKTKSEIAGFHDLAIFKGGVTL